MQIKLISISRQGNTKPAKCLLFRMVDIVGLVTSWVFLGIFNFFTVSLSQNGSSVRFHHQSSKIINLQLRTLQRTKIYMNTHKMSHPRAFHVLSFTRYDISVQFWILTFEPPNGIYRFTAAPKSYGATVNLENLDPPPWGSRLNLCILY